MSVLFDTSTLLLALQPDARPPLDPDTGQPLEHAKQRVEYLIKKLSKARTKVVIPAPVLSEVLVHAGDAGSDYIQILQQSPFRVAPFDTRAAIECADAIAKLGLKAKGKENTRAKVKFDRQIVAIAKVEQVETIYSDDQHIFSIAQQAGLRVVRSFELELDPDDRQGQLVLEKTEEERAAARPKSVTEASAALADEPGERG